MPIDFGKVKKLRIKANLSGSEAARAAGWRPQQWHDLESGRRADPQFSTVETICRVLGCSTEQITTKEKR